MNQFSTPILPTPSSELLSLKLNISQLARQLQTQKHQTKLQDDRKFWIIQNKHLSKLLIQRDNTIRSLKRISREKNTTHHSPFKRQVQIPIQLTQYQFKISLLQKQIHRLTKTLNSLTQLCQLLQSTVYSQNKQIQIIQNQNNKNRQITQFRISQSQLKYESLNRQINSQMGRPVNNMFSNVSEFKTSLEFKRKGEEDNMGEQKRSVESEIFKNSLMGSRQKEDREMVMIKKEIRELKRAIQLMKMRQEESEQGKKSTTKDETTSKKESRILFQDSFNQQVKSKKLIELRKRMTKTEEEKGKDGRREGIATRFNSTH